MSEATLKREGTIENPHVLTLQELEESKVVMRGLLTYLFTVSDRGETHLTKAELGPDTTEGSVKLRLTYNNLVDLYDIGASMGMKREQLEGLSEEPRWKELFQSGGVPQHNDPFIGFNTSHDSSGGVG